MVDCVMIVTLTKEVFMYKIGSFIFELIHQDFPIPSNFDEFICEDVIDEIYEYRIDVVDEIEILEKQLDFQKTTIKIITQNNLEKRYLILQGDSHPYAVYEEIDETHARILVARQYLSMMLFDTMFVSLLALERHMNVYHEYILHSSYICLDHKAILFTAPSGTGKSTQADLWKQYRNARVINGDRSLLSKTDNMYIVNGWPVCGSSEICLNESHPLSAIVVLKQGLKNEIHRLSYKEINKILLQELTINYHNNEFVLSVLNFIDDISQQIPFYQLTCDISEEAVKCLEKQLVEDQIWMR